MWRNEAQKKPLHKCQNNNNPTNQKHIILVNVKASSSIMKDDSAAVAVKTWKNEIGQFLWHYPNIEIL